MKANQALKLRVKILETEPPIWRSIVVPSDITFARLHLILQVALGWSDSKEHQFSFAGGLGLGSADDTSGADADNERKFKLFTLVSPDKAFYYGYDFTAGWFHEITLEEVLPPEQARDGARCLGGERAAPPEGCGGPDMYQKLLQSVPAGVGSLPADFDPSAFSMQQVNDDLKALGY